ncbi:SDR family oxidoreductase [Martelella radicis]|uniref:NAD(P)-dependent dehydrogenase (Short-subunit alcohol dehydrogenase family) n=1 Tax=Martelella radicis TaxID=1397476 RepID=A0A7W6PBM6_9HYPH|nr:SDR family oxidoreductase [Martelella radicis]MBB4124060.1 NAD(P)-dependent dehydrogenase (short-subunit alcohol dehydrogenase family) [Martelella radicis]
MKTILITGCSSGFGLETAKAFLDRGDKVIATMRTPDAALFPASENLKILPLDVTDPDSIAAAVETAGPVDILVNNAGIGWLNALEGTPVEVIRRVFETNTIGLMALTQAFLPQFRARGSGAIVNVTSSVTIRPLHLLAVYTASKAAVNAFSECLALELAPFGINVRIVLPGRSPATDFGKNAAALSPDGMRVPAAYQELADGVFRQWAEAPADLVTHPEDVAEAVLQAATDPAMPMRIPAGADAKAEMAALEGGAAFA